MFMHWAKMIIIMNGFKETQKNLGVVVQELGTPFGTTGPVTLGAIFL
jgi:hypothetical protein